MKRYLIALPGKTALHRSKPLTIWEAFDLYTELFTLGLKPKLITL